MRIWVNFSYTWIDSASHSLPLLEVIWLADLPPKSFAQIHEWLIGWLRKIGTRRAPTNDKWSYTPSSGVKTPVVTQVWGHLYGLQTSLVTGKGPPCRLILPDLSVKVGIHDVLGVTHLEFSWRQRQQRVDTFCSSTIGHHKKNIYDIEKPVVWSYLLGMIPKRKRPMISRDTNVLGVDRLIWWSVNGPHI